MQTIENAHRIRVGAMGLGITDDFLARSVELAGGRGVTSLEGVDHILARSLQDGDPTGSIMRVIDEFERRFQAHELADYARSFYIEGGKTTPGYRKLPMFGNNPSKGIEGLSVLGGYWIVRTAKVGRFLQGPEVKIAANKLEEVQTPIPSVVFGGMLAGLDEIEISAGLPFQIRGMVNALCGLESVKYKLDVHSGSSESRDSRNAGHFVRFNPRRHIGRLDGELKPPKITGVASSNVAIRFLTDQTRHPNAIDQLKVEFPEETGGHSTKPRDIVYNKAGEYQYGPKDKIDLKLARKLTDANGIQLTVAGGYSTPEDVKYVIEEIGADSVTVATIFQYCRESGLPRRKKDAIIAAALSDNIRIFNDPRISPTGYAFRVVSKVPGILSIGDPEVYEEWNRTDPNDIDSNNIPRDLHKECTMGRLRERFIRNGRLAWRCKSEPVRDFVRKGGKEEATHGAGCACEMLMEPIDLGQIHDDGYVIPGLYSAGAKIGFLGDSRLMRGRTSYSARDTIQYLVSALS